MNYESVMQKIKELENFGSKPGLERISKLLDLVGNPQNKLNCIHVAGTNGKGSVCFALDAVLRAEGYNVGRYISPGISDFRERISINGENINKKQLVELFEFFEPYIQKSEFKNDPVTEFELTTAIAFKFFADNNCEIAIIETGLGGKLDATNVIEKPICSVITPIDLDHTNVLGNSIKEIALEKFGIIKQKCPVVISDNQQSEVYKLAEKFDPYVFRSYKSDIKVVKSDGISCTKGISFIYQGEEIQTQLFGNHQFVNLACALKTLEVIKNKLPVQVKNITKALNSLTVPCRMECVRNNPTVILDAAHNPHGMVALADFLKENFADKKIYGIVGMFKDKDYETSLKNILSVFDVVYTVQPNARRAETLEKITVCAKKYCRNVVPCGNIRLAVDEAMKIVKSDDIIIVFGSFSVMRDFKNLDFDT